MHKRKTVIVLIFTDTIEQVFEKKAKTSSLKTNKIKPETSTGNNVDKESKQEVCKNEKIDWKLKCKYQVPDSQVEKTKTDDIYEFQD